MTPTLIAAIIYQVVIPEILEIVRRRQAAGQGITDAEIIAALKERVDAIVAEGENWLITHPV
jgi:hypothetical protein